MKTAITDHRLTTRIVAGLAVVALIVHLLPIHRYGYFRDELYYIACARHLDFGYVDLALLSAFLLRIELIFYSARNMDYRQRSPDIKIIFTGDRAITLAR